MDIRNCHKKYQANKPNYGWKKTFKTNNNMFFCCFILNFFLIINFSSGMVNTYHPKTLPWQRGCLLRYFMTRIILWRTFLIHFFLDLNQMTHLLMSAHCWPRETLTPLSEWVPSQTLPILAPASQKTRCQVFVIMLILSCKSVTLFELRWPNLLALLSKIIKINIRSFY